MVFIEFPELETERLRLRRIIGRDIDKVYAGLSDERVVRHYAVSFSSWEATQEQMDWFDKLWTTRTGIWWAITEKGQTDLAGSCGFNNYSAQHRRAELGYWLLPEHWGKGWATEALRAILAYGFDEMKLHRVEAFVEGGNERSNHLLERLGFQHEGTLKECEWKNGRFIDILIFSLLRKMYYI